MTIFFSMTKFTQRRLPKHYQKKIKRKSPMLIITRKWKQKQLTSCLGWFTIKPHIICDICVKNGQQWSHCCNLKLCLGCTDYFRGLCPVCEKDVLNQRIFCDICGNDGNMMTIRKCLDFACTMDVCQECSKQLLPYNKNFHFCSIRHHVRYVRIHKPDFFTR